ncbi:hypothetical protein H5T52_12895 [Candidatus Bipolaricaulota bacterium]|nr:hypothetical protein [Candidatus Bipolaricaulota bacterium]
MGAGAQRFTSQILRPVDIHHYARIFPRDELAALKEETRTHIAFELKESGAQGRRKVYGKAPLPTIRRGHGPFSGP